MKSLTFKYALKSIFFGKRKSLLTAFLYFVSTVFFVVEALSLYNYQINSSRQLDNTFGIHDGIFLCDTLQAADLIKSNDLISEAGTITVCAEGFRSEEYKDRTIILGHADDPAVSLSRINMTEGELPQNENEIALEQSLLNFIYPGSKVGDEIEMQLFMPQNETRTFTLSGIMGNMSNLQWNVSDGMLPMMNAVVSADFCPDSSIYNFVNIDCNGDSEQLDALVNDLLQTEGIARYIGNQRFYYDALGLVGGSGSSIGVTALISVLLMLTLAVLLAVSYIYKRGNGETVGLLKTAGFSASSVTAIFTVKSLLLLLPSVITGLLAGWVLSSFVSTAVSGVDGLEGVPVVLSVCGAVIILFSLLFNVSNSAAECRKNVIENLRSTGGSTSQKPSAYTTTDPILLYSVKNFILNGRETAASCIMVFLAVLIMFTALSVTSQMKSALQDMARPYDMRLGFPDEEVTMLSVKLNNELGISDNEYTALKESPDVGDILGLKRFDVYELTTDEVDYSCLSSNYDIFMEHKKVLGFPDDYNLLGSRLYGADDDILERLKKYLIAGDIDVQALKSGDEVILTVSGRDTGHRVGDTVKLAQGINSDPYAPSFDSITLWQREVKIAALVCYDNDISDDPMLRECLHGMIWHEDAFEQAGLTLQYRETYLTVSDKDYYDSLSGLINDLKLYYNDGMFPMLVDDFLQESKAFENSYNSFAAITTVLSIGLFIFSLISLASAVTAKITKRRRIFGFMRAIGLTKGQLFSIIFTENAISLFIAYCLGIGCSICLSFIFFSESPAGTGYPAAWSVILFLVYFSITALMCLLTASSNFRHTIIDCIRYTE